MMLFIYLTRAIFFQIIGHFRASIREYKNRLKMSCRNLGGVLLFLILKLNFVPDP